MNNVPGRTWCNTRPGPLAMFRSPEEKAYMYFGYVDTFQKFDRAIENLGQCITIIGLWLKSLFIIFYPMKYYAFSTLNSCLAFVGGPFNINEKRATKPCDYF